MSKYKVKFKLQGLEFEIEGEKDAIPSIAGGIRDQFAALLAPVDHGTKTELPTAPQAPHLVLDGSTSKRRNGAARRPAGNAAAAPSELPAFVCDPTKHGTPVQEWKGVDKAFWLLRVLTDNGTTEASVTTIAALFEKHFRRKGTLRPSNISRDFGKTNGLVAENANADPSTWYLLDGGIKHTDALIAQALQPTATSV